MSEQAFEEVDVRFDVFGHQNDEGTVALAVGQAKEHAIRTLGISGSAWPLNDDAFFGHVSEALLAELVSFCIHARRVLEITGKRGVTLQGSRWSLWEGGHEPSYETDLWKALNVILHASRLEVAAIEVHPTRTFETQGDRSIAHVIARSSRDGRKQICPSALCYAFLTLDLSQEN